MKAEYLAGIIDGEGTFQLQVRFRKIVGRFQINPRVQFGFKNLPEEAQLVFDIQRFLKAGKIYQTAGIIRFTTTNVNDTIKVCKLLLPYLRIKKEQCRKLLSIAELIKSKKNRRYIKGFKTTSFDIYTKNEMLKVVTIATTMNASKQTEKYRNTLSRDTKYYIEKIEEIYHQSEPV